MLSRSESEGRPRSGASRPAPPKNGAAQSHTGGGQRRQGRPLRPDALTLPPDPSVRSLPLGYCLLSRSFAPETQFPLIPSSDAAPSGCSPPLYSQLRLSRSPVSVATARAAHRPPMPPLLPRPPCVSCDRTVSFRFFVSAQLLARRACRAPSPFSPAVTACPLLSSRQTSSVNDSWAGLPALPELTLFYRANYRKCRALDPRRCVKLRAGV